MGRTSPLQPIAAHPSCFKGAPPVSGLLAHSAWPQQLWGAPQLCPAGLLQSKHKLSCCQAWYVQGQIISTATSGCAAQICCCCCSWRSVCPYYVAFMHLLAGLEGATPASHPTGSMTCSMGCLFDWKSVQPTALQDQQVSTRERSCSPCQRYCVHLKASAVHGLRLGPCACRPSEAASEGAAAPRVRRSRQPGDPEHVRRSRQPGEPEHERKTKSMYSKLGGKAAVDAAVLEL